MLMVAVLLLGSGFANSAFADTGALSGGHGGTLKSYNDDNIQMLNETITMNLTEEVGELGRTSNAHVQVDYTFKNTTNKKVTVLTGFPEIQDWEPLQNFEAYVDNKKMDIKKELEKVSDEDSTSKKYWLTYEMTFEPNQTLSVRNSYDQKPEGSEGARSSRQYMYILETGATWKNDIQSVDFVINLKGVDFHNITAIQPLYDGNPWQVSNYGNTLKLTINNIEPTATDNLELTMGDGAGFDSCYYKTEIAAERDNQYAATATSSKTPNDKIGISYYPCDAVDNNEKTAWITADGVDPAGQVFSYKALVFGTKIDSLFMLGGFGKYTDYSRPKKVKLTLVSKTENEAKEMTSMILDIPDDGRGSYIDLPSEILMSRHFNPDAEEHVNVEILEIYPGLKYKNLAISSFYLYSYLESFSKTNFEPSKDLIQVKTAPVSPKTEVVTPTPVQAQSASNYWWYIFGGVIVTCLAVVAVFKTRK